MISLLLVLCCLGGHVLAAPRVYALDDAEAHFEEFVKTHGKEYRSEAEKNLRFEIFKKNLININADNTRHNSSAFGINFFADMETEEFLKKYTGHVSQSQLHFCNEVNRTGAQISLLPDSFDWRRRYAVTRVKNQGRCGSCYSFSTTGNIEGQFALKHGFRVELSEQQIMDCSTYSKGCHAGSTPELTMKYLNENGGITTEEEYPYLGRSVLCQFEGRGLVTVTGCDGYVFGSEEDLMETLVKVGPLSIALDATSLQTYNGGVLPYCVARRLNHAVLLVGYGTDPVTNEQYWTVKNSWGLAWGEAGYFRLRRNENSCRMMDDVVSAKIA